MDLRNISIKGFRRFKDETNLQINGKLIALVGPNEAGKTSILRAINYLNDNTAIETSDITYRSDEDVVLKAKFMLSENEKEAANLDASKSLTVSKYQDGKRFYRLNPKPARDFKKREACAEALKQVLRNMDVLEIDEVPESERWSEVESILSQRSDEYTQSDLSTLDSFEATLSEISEDEAPEAIGNFREKLTELLEFERSHNPHQDALNIVYKYIPNILEFTEEYRDLELPYNITLYNHHDLNTREKPSKPLSELISLSELDIEGLIKATKNGDRASKNGLIDAANQKLKEKCEGRWNQSDAYLQFDLDGGQLDVLVKHESGFEIEDKYNNYSDRSDGYRQFISLQIFSLLNDIDNSILLIDEIEQHLHYDAQADLIQMLTREEKIGKVVYTTHSAGCLPEDLGSGVRLVKWDDTERKTSKVVNRFWGEDNSGGFAPLLFGMGAMTLAFFPVRNALVGEGPTEMLLLPKILREALAIDYLGFQVVHGLSSIRLEGIKPIEDVTSGAGFIVDNDDGGQELKKTLLAAGVSEHRIFSICETAGITTIEDLLDEKIWIEAVNAYVDEFGADVGAGRIRKAPDSGRIAALNPSLEPAKISIAYHVLRLAQDDPSRDVISPKHLETIRSTGEKIRSLLVNEDRSS